MLNARVQAWFADYDAYHQHPINLRIHKVLVPLLVFQVLAMLDWIGLGIPLFEFPNMGVYELSVAHLVALVALAWYLSLNVKCAAILAGYSLVCFVIGVYSPVWAVISIAVVAWGAQFVGHTIWEKKKPAFLKNMLHVLVAPLFLIALMLAEWPVDSERRTEGSGLKTTRD